MTLCGSVVVAMGRVVLRRAGRGAAPGVVPGSSTGRTGAGQPSAAAAGAWDAERTARFRTAAGTFPADARGNSRISAEDYAVALLMELDHKQHVRQVMTVAY